MPPGEHFWIAAFKFSPFAPSLFGSKLLPRISKMSKKPRPDSSQRADGAGGGGAGGGGVGAGGEDNDEVEVVLLLLAALAPLPQVPKAELQLVPQ
jgi:hypothetical protein